MRTFSLLVRAALAGLVIAWLALLFFQRGQTWDEAEHAHAAWLISRGERPLTDFFQHHQPLLWNLLAVYFRVGLHGPGVLIWGRILVVLAGLVSVVALLRFGRGIEGTRSVTGSWLGVIAFIALTILGSTLFVIRPETISAPLFLSAVWLWSKPVAPQRDALVVAVVGLLAGAAIYSSPRFVSLGGFFALLGTQSWRRWLGLIAGGVAFVIVYTAASGYALENVLFNLEYSALLQRVGVLSRGYSTEYWATLMLFVCAPMAALLYAIPGADRWRGVALLANSVIIFLFCIHSAGMFRYWQAFAPFVTAAALTSTWIGAHLRWPPPDGSGVLGMIAACVVIGMGLSPDYFPVLARIPPCDFLQTVRYHQWLAKLTPAGATVLLYTTDSPITVPDASYYGFPLADGQNRLCRAIDEFRTRYGPKPALPPCDYMSVLQRAKPYLTEEWIGQTASRADLKRATLYVKEHYRNLAIPRALHVHPQPELMVREGGAIGSDVATLANSSNEGE